MSYAFWYDWAKPFPIHKSRIIIDSGAFTIHSTGISLNIDGYIEYLTQHKDEYENAFSFDKIRDAEQSWENQAYIKSKGIKTIPVFHRGEEYTWLKKYIDEGYEYIALSPGATLKDDANKHIFLQKSFQMGKENKVKYHGLGCGHQWASKYPFWSIDASSYSAPKRFGQMRKFDGGLYVGKFINKDNRDLIEVLQARHLQYLYEQEVRKTLPMYHAYFGEKMKDFKVR